MKFAHSPAIFLPLLLLAGCIGNRAYRDLDTRTWHAPERPYVSGKQLPQYEPYTGAAEANHRFELSFIEFDEKGDYWDRRQLGWTIQGIRRAVAEEDAVLIIYVHGWQNDASDLPGHDPDKFRCLLQRFAEAEGHSRRVYGVYLAWRGKSVPGGDGWFARNSPLDLLSKGIFVVPHEVSFFGRKTAATQLAGMPMTEAILETVAASRQGPHRSRSVVIGHSFGALVVEKAIAQTVATQVITHQTAGEAFPTPADFIILLNSAGESIYAKELQDLLRRRKPRGTVGGSEISPERPLIVAVTSQADAATGSLFPIGTSIGNVGEKFRRYEWDDRYGTTGAGVDQREYFTTTAGHNQRLITHVAVPESTPIAAQLQDDYGCAPNMLAAVQANLREPLTLPGGHPRFVTISPGGQRIYWRIEDKLKDPALRTPYWIVQVPREISSGHSDIFNENSLALLARLFRLANPAPGPGLQMNAGPRQMRLAAPGSGPAASR